MAAVWYSLLSVLAVAILIKLRLRASSRHDGSLKLPPGPWRLPVIGSMHCLLGALPHHAMQRLARRYGPVVFLRLGHVPTLVLSSPEAAREVLKTHDVVFASRPLFVTAGIFTYGGQDLSFAPYGSKHWRKLRKLCTTELLSPKRVLSFRPIREEEAASLVRSIAAASPSPVNVKHKVVLMMNNIIMRAVAGDRCPQREAYLEEMDKALKLMSGFNLVDLFPASRVARVLGGRSLRAAREVHARINCIVGAMIQDHARSLERDTAVAGDDGDGGSAREDEDLLHVLLRLQKDGGMEDILTTEIISASMFELFSGGSETTTTTTIWAMSELMRSPRAMERTQFEIRQFLHGKTMVKEEDIQGRFHYLPMVIKETLRLHPPLPLLLRKCAKACKIMSYDIPQETTMLVNAWALARDKNHWIDAEEFRPERFDDGMSDFNGANFRFLPFGSGRRMCPGLMFGLSSIELTVASLLYHFDWKLPNGASSCELDMAESFGLTTNQRADLWLEPTTFVHMD